MSVKSVLNLIGNTPLIRLNRASALTGCEIYGKAEFLNPSQSVKDRVAFSIICDAERRGIIQKGGIIVEGTAGNTGISLAMVGAVLGYKTFIVIPQTQSQEKKDALRLQGVELIEVPAVSYDDDNNYIKLSGRLAKNLQKTTENGVLWANQFDNLANRNAHVETTAQEIWRDVQGKLDGFICSVGSGGTLVGTAIGLLEHDPTIKIGLAEPYGAALYSYYKTGRLQSEGGSIMEGIGQGRITCNLEGFRPDFLYQISDSDALVELFHLVQHEGLCLGGSSGVNIAGAIAMARELGAGKTIVTMLCDCGNRYLSNIYNPIFLRKKHLPIPQWLDK